MMTAQRFLADSKVLIYSQQRLAAWLSLARQFSGSAQTKQLQDELFHKFSLDCLVTQALMPPQLREAQFDHVGAVVAGGMTDEYVDIMQLGGFQLRPRFDSRVIARELGYSATILRAIQRVELIVVEPRAQQAVQNFGLLGCGVHIAFSVLTEHHFEEAQPALEQAGYVRRISDVNPTEKVRVAFYDGPKGRVEIVWRRE